MKKTEREATALLAAAPILNSFHYTPHSQFAAESGERGARGDKVSNRKGDLQRGPSVHHTRHSKSGIPVLNPKGFVGGGGMAENPLKFSSTFCSCL